MDGPSRGQPTPEFYRFVLNLLNLAGGSTSVTLDEFISLVSANTYGTTDVAKSGNPVNEAFSLASGLIPGPASSVNRILNAIDRLEVLLALMPRPNNFAPSIPITASALTNSLSANVSLNNVANFFDGPSVAQGTFGTWFASGTVTLDDTGIAAQFDSKLWDGTTVIASTRVLSQGANQSMSVSLSGFLANPAGNLRISCKDVTATSGLILAAAGSGNTASTLSAFRIS